MRRGHLGGRRLGGAGIVMSALGLIALEHATADGVGGLGPASSRSTFGNTLSSTSPW